MSGNAAAEELPPRVVGEPAVRRVQVLDWHTGMPRHVVVDGSNLATEGRSLPSLKQLNDAVLAFIEEHPDDLITVVVDATFGHRIDPREVADFDAAVDNNELVAPPAGAIGRGDAFVLTIANKIKATILSNDSYQEFHGEYPWLFDEGRLIGGKPVPNVGWVFVPRVPVRGPVSRRAVKDANKTSKGVARAGTRTSKSTARASRESSLPLPVPTTPPPGVKARGASSRAAAARVEALDVAVDGAAPAPTKRAPRPADQTDAPTAARPHMVNELLPFLSFVEQHPVGSSVTGVVESYSSHGAYVRLGDARGYVPLRLMASPAPRSARSVMKLGEPVELVVVSFNPTRRSIDLSVPGMEPVEVRALAGAPAPAPVKRTRKKARAAEPETVAEAPAAPVEPPVPAKRARKKTAKVVGEPPSPMDQLAAAEPSPQPAPAKRSRKKAATPAPAEPTPPARRTRKKAAEPVVVPATRARKGAVAPAPTPRTSAAAPRTRKKAAPA